MHVKIKITVQDCLYKYWTNGEVSRIDGADALSQNTAGVLIGTAPRGLTWQELSRFLRRNYAVRGKTTYLWQE